LSRRLDLRGNSAIRLVFAASVLLVFSGCRQDMHNQPKYVPYRSSEFFQDGLSERQQVVHTVARGELHEDTYLYTGKVGIKEGDRFPFPITQAVMERGRERYDIYCSPCHSRVGDGNGMIVKRGYRQAANFHDQKYASQTVGHYYDVISHGSGAMPDYATQLEPADRWAIAAYIRALQYARNGTLSDVPADQRGQLKDQSEMTTKDGVPLLRAISSGGKGGPESVPTSGNPAPAPTGQPQEGTQKK
jgi:cytochrome c553